MMFKHLHPLMGLFLVVLILTAGCRSNRDEGGDADPGKKRWKLTIVKYEDLQQTEDAEKGLRAGLRDAGLEEGKDFELQIRSAQGDIAAVLGLVDACQTDGTDMLISLQTPTLHTAVKRAVRIPVVFMVVANPFVISTVGESDSVHLPNITGIYTMTTFDRMLDYIKEVLPNVKRIGTLFATSELNSTFYKSQLYAAANRRGIAVESFGVSSRLDVPQAMQALCGKKKLDAICQIEDNLTSAAFPAIAQVARRYKLPVFSFVNAQARTGSSIVMAPDYHDAARETGFIISRIMKGESPANIPFQRIRKFNLIINLAHAQEAGLNIPAELVGKADEVLRDGVASR